MSGRLERIRTANSPLWGIVANLPLKCDWFVLLGPALAVVVPPRACKTRITIVTAT